MRHNKSGRTLGRDKQQREALMRNLAESLVLHGAITTTVSKAKELRTFIEPLVTKAGKNTLAARRQLIKALYTEKVVQKLMDDIGPRYVDRPGGYTRITKIGYRKNDSAPVARIEFV